MKRFAVSVLLGVVASSPKKALKKVAKGLKSAGKGKEEEGPSFSAGMIRVVKIDDFAQIHKAVSLMDLFEQEREAAQTPTH